ncbi:hypothetical protein I4U23_016220 [Adineta vaga]|nr:hypothetical protein I4U23_016220 [Adineta vaga]
MSFRGKNGEDEANCMNLDINICEDNEYRCNNGMCIGENFRFDGFYDCADGSDEQELSVSRTEGYYKSLLIEREERNCGSKTFSCDDGTCFTSPFYCNSGLREAFSTKLFANTHEINSTDTLCWQAMICSMASVLDWFKLRQTVCPKYYFFPSKFLTSYFSTYFMCILRTRLIDSRKDCLVGDDELYPFTCSTNKTLGCKYIRNEVSENLNDYFIFQELCNGITRFKNPEVNSETDEDNCQEWKNSCKNRAESCSVYKNSLNNTMIDRIIFHCNRGLLLNAKDGTDRCLCSPGYSGERCQNQNRRILLIISVNTSGFDNHLSPALRLVASLISESNNEVYSISQMTHLFSNHKSFWRYLVTLRYPNELNSNHFYVNIDVFLLFSKTVSHLSSWRYEIPFQHILPVNRIRAHLQLNQVKNNNTCSLCSNGKCINYQNNFTKFYCLCNTGWYGKYCDHQFIENITSCALGAQVLFKNICICPLFSFGYKCYIELDLLQTKCANGGTLLVEYSSSLCLCPKGFHGSTCQLKDASIMIKFSNTEYNEKRIPVIALHLLDLYNDINVTDLKVRTVYSNVHVPSILPTIYLHERSSLPSFILVQLYVDKTNVEGEFYLIALLKPRVNKLVIDMKNIIRCPHVKTLLNSTIINKYSRWKRYKQYFRICLINDQKCFVDEQYVCLCDNLNRFECLWFDHQASNCIGKGNCQNGGHCVEPSLENEPIKFACFCPSCTLGDICQFTTTASYSISLDALVGRHGAVGNSSLFYIFFIGLIFNLFSFIILCHSTCQDKIGSEFSILCLTVVGQFGLIEFVVKFIFLYLSSISYECTYWSCIITESTIIFLSALFDFLTACIAIERTFIIIQGAKFIRSRSKFIAKYITLPIVITMTFGTTFHKVFYRKVINDFRTNEPSWWCILEINQPIVKTYDIVKNIIHFMLPLAINLLTVLYFLFATTQRKYRMSNRQANETTSYYMILRGEFNHHIAFIVSPIIFGVFQTPRLIVAFSLVCIQTAW